MCRRAVRSFIYTSSLTSHRQSPISIRMVRLFCVNESLHLRILTYNVSRSRAIRGIPGEAATDDMAQNTRPLIICPFIQLLAFLLICQTVREIEGHSNRELQRPGLSIYNRLNPTRIKRTRRSSNEESQESGESQEFQEMTKLIDKAFKDHELLRPDNFSTNTRRQRPVQGDTTSKSQDLKRISRGVNKNRNGMTMLNDGFVFPNDEIARIHNTTQRQMPKPSVCEGATFCEKVPGYPRELIDRAIERTHNTNLLETLDEEVPEVIVRTGGGEDSLCVASPQLVFPQTAQNKEKKWLFVVNQENLKQGIRIEVCKDEGKECHLIEGFAEHYRTECKQKYVYRALLAVTDNGTVGKDYFRFAASCCCHVYSDFGVMRK